MKIFRIKHTDEAPIVIPVPDPDAFVREVLNNLEALSEQDKVNPFQLYDPTQREGDFFRVTDKVLLFTEEIYLGPLGEALQFSGNVYPTRLTDTGQELFFLNVTAVYNCIDRSKSTFFRGRRGNKRDLEVGVDHGKGVFKPAFYPKLIGDSAIFRLPEMPYGIFVASERSGYDPEEDFCHLYEAAGVRGLEFEEMWSE